MFLSCLACALGAVGTTLVQSATPSGWWLNSRPGIAVTVGVVALISCAVTTPLAGVADRVAGAVGTWTGATLAVVWALVSIGPGTLWPIVIAIGASILAGGAALGLAVGIVAGELVDTAKRRP